MALKNIAKGIQRLPDCNSLFCLVCICVSGCLICSSSLATNCGDEADQAWQVIPLCLLADVTGRWPQGIHAPRNVSELRNEIRYFNALHPVIKQLNSQLPTINISVPKKTFKREFIMGSTLRQNTVKITRIIQHLVNNEHQQPSDDLLHVTPNMLAYRFALMAVLPEHSSRIKQSLLTGIANNSQQNAAARLIDIALLEFFSGATTTAQQTIRHAVLHHPEQPQVLFIQHFLHQANPHLNHLIKQMGFDWRACGKPDEEIRISLAAITSPAFQQLLQIIMALPHDEQRLRSLFLLSLYLDHLNGCHFIDNLLDYRIATQLSHINNDKDYLRLTIATIKAYRRYR